jgi:5-oxoprolinase (ATP-hydrolysing)
MPNSAESSRVDAAGRALIGRGGSRASPIRIAKDGATSFDAVAAALRAAPFPSRAPDDDLADLGAQLAANRRGAERVSALISRHGLDAVLDAMARLRAHARAAVGDALKRLGVGPHRAEATLDDGTRIVVTVDTEGARPRVSFSGTSSTHSGSLDATPAVTRACVLYALRLLSDEALPLNEGFLEAIDLDVPEGLLNPPFDPDPARCPAVVAGNVETSQRVVDVLLAAFRVGAASQGTMNNVTFGHAKGSHYETIGGGAGATRDGDGASGVQVHMTNTRITDPETLEMRHAVRLLEFAYRRGSGGEGRRRGGDGLVRAYELLAPATVSLLAQRRTSGPEGAEGGGDGLPGTQAVHRVDGSIDRPAGMSTFAVAVGDVLVVETPGGGGFGARD